MLKSLSVDTPKAFDVVTIVAGLGLALAPWYLGFTTETAAAWNAWIVGAAVTLVAVAALFAFHQVEEWANAALGLWAIAAPWALGFSALSSALTAHVIAGLVVAAVAAARLWFTTGRPYSSA